jgi:nitrogenase subunit NifH
MLLAQKVFFGNYKGGVGKTTTVFEIGALMAERHNKSITKIGVKSKVTGTMFAAPTRNHIFNSKIRHLDNRSNPNNYGIPITLSNGEIHEEYAEITEAVVNLI